MNLKTYSIGITLPIYGSICNNRIEAKKYILNHPKAVLVDYVIYKNKKYTITEVYKWR